MVIHTDYRITGWNARDRRNSVIYLFSLAFSSSLEVMLWNLRLARHNLTFFLYSENTLVPLASQEIMTQTGIIRITQKNSIIVSTYLSSSHCSVYITPHCLSSPLSQYPTIRQKQQQQPSWEKLCTYKLASVEIK